MPYTIRDDEGLLIGLLEWPNQEGQEFLPDDSAEVQAFLNPPEEGPDWPQFRQQALLSPAFLRIITASPVTQALNPALQQFLWQVGGNPAIVGELAAVWDAIATEANPTTAEIDELNGIATQANIPLRLDEQGKLVPLS